MTRAVHGRLGTWYLFFCVSLAYALIVVVVVLRFDNPLSLIFDSVAICLMVFFLIMRSFALSLALYVFLFLFFLSM